MCMETFRSSLDTEFVNHIFPTVLIFCVWINQCCFTTPTTKNPQILLLSREGLGSSSVWFLVCSSASVLFTELLYRVIVGALNSWIFESSVFSLFFQGILQPEHDINSWERGESETHLAKAWDFLLFVLSFYYFCLMISQPILLNSQCIAVGRASKGTSKGLPALGRSILHLLIRLLW